MNRASSPSQDGRSSEARLRQSQAWARSLAPIVNELLKDGYFGMSYLAEALEARGCATQRGGRWTRRSTRILCRHLVAIGCIADPKNFARPRPFDDLTPLRRAVERNRQALRDNADDFARSMAPILSSLRAHGVTSYSALAKALNERGILPLRATRWTGENVRHLSDRLRAMAARDDRESKTERL